MFLVGSVALVTLAGCGRGLFQSAEREAWRREAELACLKSGVVREGVNIVRSEPISGPGICGADFPLTVAAIGGSGSLGYADDMRPPGSVPTAPRPAPNWPISPAAQSFPASQSPSGMAGPAPGPGAPISLSAPGVPPPVDDEDAVAVDDNQARMAYPRRQARPVQADPMPRLGPAPGARVNAVGPVAIKPTATLACPIVSELDRWISETVQPAAMRWFGTPVAEIKQISAYSCRGMNGNRSSRISEHAFGNALDIAAFTLADGRRVTVKEGWSGMPEEQGFLRDVQGGACQQFATVLAPGSNIYHYDHIHVDLMRRASGRIICQPGAVSGEVVAARASQRGRFASRDPSITGSLASMGKKLVAPFRRQAKPQAKTPDDDDADDE